MHLFRGLFHTQSLPLFLISFLILFVELTLIRIIPAYVINTAYFTNLILMASFLGTGIGLLMSNIHMRIFYWFPVLFTGLLAMTQIQSIYIDTTMKNIFFYGSGRSHLPAVLAASFIFLCVAAVFVPLGQELGRRFKNGNPLSLYCTNIVGSLFAVILFTLCAWYWTPPTLWFAIVSIPYLLLVWNTRLHRLVAIVLFVPIVLLSLFTLGDIWSPYYKLTLTKLGDDYVVSANNIGHQMISRFIRQPSLYQLPYNLIGTRPISYILIIGAGSGIDTASALARSAHATSIDAVEIDPAIAYLGKTLNPNHPYQDPRVHLHIMDGRKFLSETDKTYDLIIFAMTDSLLTKSYASNIRLESFLFTEDAFRLARDRLSHDGIFVLYNAYHEKWISEKIGMMLTTVFGHTPNITRFTEDSQFVALTTARAPLSLTPQQQLIFLPFSTTQTMAPSTDDWPFIYLLKKTIPIFYLMMIVIISGITTLGVSLILKKKIPQFLFNPYLLLGAAYMLIEAKSVVTFSLLFGSTWIVNSFVFIAMLTMSLITVLVSTKITISKITLFIFLMLSLVLGTVTPISFFARLPLAFSYPIAGIYYFLPPFFSSLLFAQLYKKTADPVGDFAASMIGGVFGGLLEYLALAIGYRLLGVVTLFLYGVLSISLLLKQKQV